jgi:hypothetical protein
MNASQKKRGGLAATPWRHLPCWFWWTTSYKTWLYEEKKTHQTNLLTEHDSPPSYGKPSIVDKILDGVQFTLDEETASPTVIYDKTDRTYKKLEKERVKSDVQWCSICNSNNDARRAAAENNGQPQHHVLAKPPPISIRNFGHKCVAPVAHVSEFSALIFCPNASLCKNPADICVVFQNSLGKYVARGRVQTGDP